MLKKLAALLVLGMGAAIAAAPLAAQPLVINTAWDSDDSSVLVGDITRAVNRVAMEFPEVRGATVTSEVEPIGVYAYAARPKLAFNDLYLSHPAIFNSMIHYDVEHGFHPSLGICSPAEFVAYHEAAHLIDQGKGLAPHKRLVERVLDGETFPGLPTYAYVGPGEALAEAFASVTCNGGNATEQDLYEVLTN